MLRRKLLLQLWPRQLSRDTCSTLGIFYYACMCMHVYSSFGAQAARAESSKPGGDSKALKLVLGSLVHSEQYP